MLKRKDSAKFAKSVLLTEYNDIDIYFEDTATEYKKIYIHLFQRVFEGIYSIKDVFPIGSRGNVIKKCNEINTSVKRPSLFVVDGDLYLLTGEKPLPNGMFRVPAYCIENILLDKNAIINYLDEEHTELRVQQIDELFAYDLWKAACEIPLVKLFITYATVTKLKIPNIPNVSIPVSSFIKANDNTLIDNDAVLSKLLEIETIVDSTVHAKEYHETWNNIARGLDKSVCQLTTYVSGKDYLYPLIYKKMSDFLAKPIAHKNLKQRLAMRCDISKLNNCRAIVIVPQGANV